MFKNHQVILVIPFGDEEIEVARHTVGMFKDAFEYTKTEIYATILAPGISERGAVAKYPEILKVAFKAGQEVLRSLK